jgi:hypothetical protein
LLTSVVLATPNARPLRPWPSPARRRRWLLKTTIAGRRAIWAAASAQACSRPAVLSLLPMRGSRLARTVRPRRLPSRLDERLGRRFAGLPAPGCGPGRASGLSPIGRGAASAFWTEYCATLVCSRSVPSGRARARAHVWTLAPSPVPGPPTRSLAGLARRRVGPAQVPADRCYAVCYAPDRLTRAPWAQVVAATPPQRSST